MFWYLYAVMDVYSRKIVVWQNHDKNHGLRQRADRTSRVTDDPLVLHSDNGGPMKSGTLRTKLLELGITSSYS